MRTRLRISVAALVAVPLLFVVVVMTSRVGEQARFVTWPVVAFTALAGAVAVVGVWTGARRPSLLLAGLLPAVIVSYFLPAAPFAFVALVLVAIGGLAVAAGGVASGMAAAMGVLMAVFVVVQDPAVECGESSVSASSGPWWIDEPASSTGSGSITPDRDATGNIQVGDHRYRYTCDNGRLRSFDRVAEAGARATRGTATP